MAGGATSDGGPAAGGGRRHERRQRASATHALRAGSAALLPMAENRNPNRSFSGDSERALPALLSWTTFSPTLVRNNQSLVRENARVLLGHSCGSPADVVAALRRSRRFQDLVSSLEQQRSGPAPVHASASSSAAGLGSGDRLLCETQRRAFAVLRRHAAAQQCAVHGLQRSLAAWRRWRLSQHLVHWQGILKSPT